MGGWVCIENVTKRHSVGGSQTAIFGVTQLYNDSLVRESTLNSTAVKGAGLQRELTCQVVREATAPFTLLHTPSLTLGSVTPAIITVHGQSRRCACTTVRGDALVGIGPLQLGVVLVDPVTRRI